MDRLEYNKSNELMQYFPMSKKIKKQIKRSMPVFLVFSLLVSSVAIGLAFNFDFGVLDIEGHDVRAADTASTTVTVLNNPPDWSVYPAESPGSTSTSPVNVGEGITFTATADDTENNSYYLAVCTTNSITASTTGGEPTCDVAAFCISSLTADTVEASCASSTIGDPGAETYDWYAFVCDNHSSEGACSSVSQGANEWVLATSSPLHINHAPNFTFVWTSDDNKDPGANYTVTASTTDSDVLGGADGQWLYVCNTDSFATSTGCAAGEFLCFGAATSTDNVTCSFATTTPAIDGSGWSYYAFIMDNHYFPATDNSRSSTYTVNNVAPQVSSVVLNDGLDITVNMRGMSATSTTLTATIDDDNACVDIASATGTIFWSSVSGGYGCAADDDDCYPIAAVNCVQDAGSCTDGNDSDATYTCTTTMAFNAIPTDDANGNTSSSTSWWGAIRGVDEALGHVATSSVSQQEVIQTVALFVTEDEIPYGSLSGGTDSGADNATTTINNYGNTPINSEVSGSDMTGPATITVDNQKYDTSSTTYASLTWTLSGSDTERDIDASRPTTSNLDIFDELFWGINIPGGTLSGDYTGTTTFTPVVDSGDW